MIVQRLIIGSLKFRVNLRVVFTYNNEQSSMRLKDALAQNKAANLAMSYQRDTLHCLIYSLLHLCVGGGASGVRYNAEERPF